MEKYPLLPKLDRKGRRKKKRGRLRKGHCVCGRPAAGSDGSCGKSIGCVLKLCKIRARRNEKRKEKQHARLNPLIEVERTYTPMEDLQRRNKFQKGLRAHLASLNVELVRPLKVCTGILRPGQYCITCKTVHVESLKHKWKTGNPALDNYTAKHDAGYSAFKRETNQAQFRVFAKAAKQLRERRRRREKKLDLPKNYFLRDYSLEGGGNVDFETQQAVLESFEIQGMDASSFNARID